jgi:hypothetical protein
MVEDADVINVYWSSANHRLFIGGTETIAPPVHHNVESTDAADVILRKYKLTPAPWSMFNPALDTYRAQLPLTPAK